MIWTSYSQRGKSDDKYENMLNLSTKEEDTYFKK